MKKVHKAMEAICEGLELFDTVKEGKLKMGELDAIEKIFSALDHASKYCERMEESGYSQTGYYGIGSSYGGGYSGRHLVRAHYSRDGGMSHDGGDYSGRRGRYSRSGASESMLDNLQSMLDNSGSDRERQAIQLIMDKLERD